MNAAQSLSRCLRRRALCRGLATPRSGMLKYAVRNRAVLRELRRLRLGGGKRSSNKGIVEKSIIFDIPPVGRRSQILLEHGNPMKQHQSSRIVLSVALEAIAQQQELFALLNLGLVQSLTSGVISPSEAVERFYHAENCLYVQKHFRQKAATRS